METASQPATASATGIRRTGPPQAIQKARENLFLVQAALSEPPSADWKRFFYDLQRDFPPDFPPRSVDVSGAALRFRSEPASVEQKIALIDRWIVRANQKEASLGVRSEAERLRREEAAREHTEMAEWNARWAKL
jgi:hypothetical protein